jgi:C1A family cysteine protease
MKVVFLLCLLFIGITLGAPSKDDLTIKEFEEKYHDFFEDPEKEKEAADQLAKEEEDIDLENELFAEGKAHFTEQLQPWDILSKEEFEKEKEGLLPGKDEADRSYDFTANRHMGKLRTPEHEKVNTPEELAFLEDLYSKYDRAALPASWDSRAKGWISSVKNQGSCGSCVAFATAGMAEATLIKAGAAKSGLDLSEQWLVDCKPAGANGCNGAGVTSYSRWMPKNGNLMHENAYPYKGSATFQCPSGPYWSPGYKLDKTVIDWNCNEAKIMKQIMEYGSSIMAVYASDYGFGNYKQGVFDTCSPTRANHQVLGVGWGTENGIPYWLIKNSWGSGYGDKGYVKVKRGTCGTDEECGVMTAVKTTGVAGNVPPAPPPSPIKACDLKKYIGDATGSWTINGVPCTCMHGQCSVAGAKDSCIAICGQSPC